MSALVDQTWTASPPRAAPAPAAQEGRRRKAADPSFGGVLGGLAVDADGVVFVSDSHSGTIWRLSPHRMDRVRGVLQESASDPGQRMLTPAGLALAPGGSLLVADASGHRIWLVSAEGEFSVLAGSVYGYRDGPAAEALFRFPSDVAIGADGTIYVADTGNDAIRTISPDGIVGTLAGSIYDYGDGRGSSARFRHPRALAVDAAGSCFVADTGNNAVRRIAPDGEVSTVAGSPPGGDSDGVGTGAGLRWPSGLALDATDRLFVADTGNNALRQIDDARACTTLHRFARRHWPTVVATAGTDTLVVASATLDDTLSPRAQLFWIPLGGQQRVR